MVVSLSRRVAAAVALACLAAHAFADFAPTSGTAEYTTPANWTPAVINGRFTAPGTNGLTVTFNQDWPQTASESGLLFDCGSGTVTLQSDSATARLLTLNGNVMTGSSTTGNVVTIGGGSAAPLSVSLGGTTRTFSVAAGNTVTLAGAGSTTDIQGAGFGIVKTGAGTLVVTGNSSAGYGGDGVTAVNVSQGTFSTDTGNTLGKALTVGTATANNIIINGGATFQFTRTTGTTSLATERGILIGPGDATIEVTNAAAQLTINGLINDNGGAGRLVKTGAGILQLNTSTNNYSGGTLVQAGAIGFASESRFGAVPGSQAAGANNIIINAGAGLICTSTTNTSINVNRGIAIGPTSGSGSGDVFINVPNSAAFLGIDGVITNNGSGTGRLVLNGPGAVRLQGGATDTGQNLFSGGILVNGGTLRLRAVGAAGTGPGGVGTNALITLAGTGAVLEPMISSSRTYNADILITADVALQTGRNSTGNGVTATFGALTVGANTVTVNPGFQTNVDTNYGFTIGGATTLTGNPTFVVNNNGAGIGTFRMNGAISGGFGITKSGAGPMILAGANTYTGPTTVTAGTLKVTSAGSIASSSAYKVTGGTLDVSAVSGGLAVSAGKTLGGNGTVVGNLTLAGTVAPGGSIGTLTAGGMTWQPGGNYAFEHNPSASGTPGTTNDFINGTGQLDLSQLSSGSPFNLTLIPNGTFPATPASQTYTLATFTGGILGPGGTPFADQANVSNLFTPGPGSGFTSYDPATFVKVVGAAGGPQSLQVTFTPVPEPELVLLACGGLAGLAGWRRKRRRV